MGTGNSGHYRNDRSKTPERKEKSRKRRDVGWMSLSDHMLLPRKARMAHLDLSTPCEFPDFSHTQKRRLAGKNLRLLLELEGKADGVTLCHHCAHNSTNGMCTNPLHLSFGTWAENHSDKTDEARSQGGHTTSQALKENPETRRKHADGSRRGAAILNAQKWKSTYDGFVSTAGNVAKHNKKLGVSPDLRVRVV